MGKIIFPKIDFEKLKETKIQRKNAIVLNSLSSTILGRFCVRLGN